MEISIRPAGREDAGAVAAIYNYYVETTHHTFETESLARIEMAKRISEIASAGLPWLVAEDSGEEIVGFSYASRWKGRCAYRFSVESSVYVANNCTGRGIGRKLYASLIDTVRSDSMHSIIAGIALPSDHSVRFHEQVGFKKVAQFEEVGYKFDRWIDVGYWQMLL